MVDEDQDKSKQGSSNILNIVTPILAALALISFIMTLSTNSW